MIEAWKRRCPEKFAAVDEVFRNIRRGNRIFVGTGCGEPRYLVQGLHEHLRSSATTISKTERPEVWRLGIAPYAHLDAEPFFRHRALFPGDHIPEVVSREGVQYVPVNLSDAPALFHRRRVPIDAALIQVSPPDRNGFMSLGISVDVTKAAAETASMVVAQVNEMMPRVHGETFIHMQDVDFVIPHNEGLLEFRSADPDEITRISRTEIFYSVCSCHPNCTMIPCQLHAFNTL